MRAKDNLSASNNREDSIRELEEQLDILRNAQVTNTQQSNIETQAASEVQTKLVDLDVKTDSKIQELEQEKLTLIQERETAGTKEIEMQDKTWERNTEIRSLRKNLNFARGKRQLLKKDWQLKSKPKRLLPRKRYDLKSSSS